MDNGIYEAIKAALATGKDPADVTADLRKLVARAQEELRPKTPVRDTAMNVDTLKTTGKTVVGITGAISKPTLARILAGYLCQQGVTPDNLYKTLGGFTEAIEKSLDNMVTNFKISTGKIKGYSQFEYKPLTELFFGDIGKSLAELLREDGSKSPLDKV